MTPTLLPVRGAAGARTSPRSVVWPRRGAVMVRALLGAALASAAIVAPGARLPAAQAAGSPPNPAHAAGSRPGAAAPPGVRLLPNVLPHLDLATRLGPAPPDATMGVAVALAHPDPAGEEAAYRAMYDPASPAYHRFLGPAAYAARFGVAPAVTGAAVAWLGGGGLSVDQVSSARDVVFAHGTVARLEALLHTPITRFRAGSESGAVDFMANELAPSVPAALPVTTVVGLNTLQRFGVPSRGSAAPAPSVAGRTAGVGSAGVGSAGVGSAGVGSAGVGSAGVGSPGVRSAAGTFNGTFHARDLWRAYDMPDSDLGQGQSIAIFGEGDTDPVIANLRIYEQREGLPQVPARVVHTEQGTHGDVSGEIEWDLDSAASTGMAPMASSVSYYFADRFFDADVLTVFSAWAGDAAGPLQANASFGECETDPLNPLVGSPILSPQIPFGQGLGNNMELASEPILRQATMEGRTLFTSAGDTAGACPSVVLPIIGAGNGLTPQPVPIQSYPAVSRYAVSVGGTVLTTDAAKTKRVDEVSWTFTGGGSSGFVAEPDFQKKVAAINRACVTDPTGTPYPAGTVCRGVPDIAADSSGTVGDAQYSIVADMATTGQGGTSLSSPLTVGMWARIQSAAPKGGLGYANPSFYTVGTGPSGARDFFDVIASETPAGNVYNQPGPGWDYTSGFGVPDVAHLMDDLDGRRTPTDPAGPAAVPPNPLGGDCGPVFVSPQGNATDPVTQQEDPSLDFTAGQFALVEPAPGAAPGGAGPLGPSLVLTMSGPGLSPSLPPTFSGGADFTVFWTYAGTTYFGQAHVTPPGQVSYVDGRVDPTMGLVPGKAVQGTFTTGVLRITVPLADVGNPPTGARLGYPYGLVAGLVGASGAVALPVTADAGSNNDYQLGFTCPAAAAPAAPAAPPAASPGAAPSGSGTGGPPPTGSPAGGAGAGPGMGAGGGGAAPTGSLPATGAPLDLLALWGGGALAAAMLLRGRARLSGGRRLGRAAPGAAPGGPVSLE